MELIPGQPQASVRGVRAFDGPAGIAAASGAWLVDLAAYLGAASGAAWWLGALPIPSALGAARGIAVLAGLPAFLVLQEYLCGATLGQAVWGLSRAGAPLLSALKCRVRPSMSSRFLAMFLTLTLAGAASFLATAAVLRHPVSLRAAPTPLQPWFPSAPEARDWMVSPYFYALGAWPRMFSGQPVLHSLPYQKGPPTQFIGQIVARWELPSIRVTFEGPKTPAGASGPGRLRDCLSEDWDFGCWPVRRAALERHVREMARVSPVDWELRWFEVETAAIPPEERARGFHLVARGEHAAEERFVLVNAQGAQQAFILERPAAGEAAERASRTFQLALRSQRVSTSLVAGRAWVDRELEATKLSELAPLRDPAEFSLRMAGVLSLLLSKASVDPRGLDAYFHLGGSALLLARRAAAEKRPDWGAAAKPLIQAALRYAGDVAPDDPRTRQLEQLWLEASKY